MSFPWVSRREALGLVLAAASPAWASAASGTPRLAALDWTLGSVAAELGVAPVGLCEKASYATWVGVPPMPAETIELGLRTAPGLEGLMQLRPELILASEFNTALQPKLEAIAPVFMNTIYRDERAPLARAGASTRELADRLGRAEAGANLVAAADAAIAQAGTGLAISRRPVLPLNLIDPHHMIFYGRGSLYADVLAAMGLRSAFGGATGQWGSTSGGLDMLVRTGPAELLIIDPVRPDCEPLVAETGLLSRIAAAQGSRIYRLPTTWPFGAMSAATRFATNVRTALLAGAGRA